MIIKILLKKFELSTKKTLY